MAMCGVQTEKGKNVSRKTDGEVLSGPGKRLWSLDQGEGHGQV